jgi:hypothetical protein
MAALTPLLLALEFHFALLRQGSGIELTTSRRMLKSIWRPPESATITLFRREIERIHHLAQIAAGVGQLKPVRDAGQPGRNAEQTNRIAC